MAASKSTSKKAELPKAGSVYGTNPGSGGGTVVVSAVDEGGFELLDLASGQREKVATGAKPVTFADVDEGGGS